MNILRSTFVPVFGATAAVSMFAAACVVTPAQPTDAFVRAAAAIDQAERSGAAEYAPTELVGARDKLALAESESSGSGTTVHSIRWAEEARVDAKLAGERARAKRAEVAANEVDKSGDALRVEAERPTT